MGTVRLNIQKKVPIQLHIAPVKTFGVAGDDSGVVFVLVDDDGREAIAIYNGDSVTLDATPNDIRIGKTAATVDGVTVGEKIIPSYHSTEGNKVIKPGQAAQIVLPKELDLYDYTELQAIVCTFSQSIPESVAAEKVVIDGKVYDVLSTISLSELVKDAESKTINLGIVNDTETPWIIRYFTYKEIY